jgi:hypothetical protein
MVANGEIELAIAVEIAEAGRRCTNAQSFTVRGRGDHGQMVRRGGTSLARQARKDLKIGRLIAGSSQDIIATITIEIEYIDYLLRTGYAAKIVTVEEIRERSPGGTGRRNPSAASI